MATIVARKGATGPSFQARERLTRDGDLIHKESKAGDLTLAALSRAMNGQGSARMPMILDS